MKFSMVKTCHLTSAEKYGEWKVWYRKRRELQRYVAEVNTYSWNNAMRCKWKMSESKCLTMRYMRSSQSPTHWLGSGWSSGSGANVRRRPRTSDPSNLIQEEVIRNAIDIYESGKIHALVDVFVSHPHRFHLCLHLELSSPGRLLNP